jgi:hypothetical protein
MAAAMPAQQSWPSRPTGGEYYADYDRARPDRAALDQALSDQGPAHGAIAEMAALLRETRGSMIVGGTMLGAVTIGIALEAAFSARMRSGVVEAVNVGLLCGLLFCWLRAVILLALAGRPVLRSLSEMRWKTGAPLDPRPRWATLPPTGTDSQEWTWMQAHLLLGAARLARSRMQLADTWTYVTAAYFLLWTAIVLLGG